MIESGVKLSDIPPPTSSDSSKEVPFKNFLFLLSGLNTDDLNPSEIELLESIQNKLHEIIKGNGIS